MGKKVTGIILIVLGIIPFAMKLLPTIGLGPGGGGPSGGDRIPSGNFPAGGGFPGGGVSPSGMTPPSGGMPSGGFLFGILRTLNEPYVLVIAAIIVVIGVILLTHKDNK